MNPTTDVLEQRIAALEGGIGAGAGIGTIGRHVRNPDDRRSRRQHRVREFAVRRHLQPVRAYATPIRDHDALRRSARPASFEPLIDARTKAIFAESVGNPLGNVTDIAALAEVAHRHGIPLIVDNTVPSPYLLRPFEHGADIVVHSLTKYLGGHGTSLGGAIVDSGKFRGPSTRTASSG